MKEKDSLEVTLHLVAPRTSQCKLQMFTNPLCAFSNVYLWLYTDSTWTVKDYGQLKATKECLYTERVV